MSRSRWRSPEELRAIHAKLWLGRGKVTGLRGRLGPRNFGDLPGRARLAAALEARRLADDALRVSRSPALSPEEGRRLREIARRYEAEAEKLWRTCTCT